MFPEIDYNMEVDAEEEERIAEEEVPVTLGSVPLYDFDKRQYVIKDGKIVEATQDQAIGQWVAFLILTKMGKYPVYRDTNFGTYIENYIGYRSNNIGFVSSEFKREIEEGCEMHPLIDRIEGFEMTKENGVTVASLSVVKKDGQRVEVREIV